MLDYICQRRRRIIAEQCLHSPTLAEQRTAALIGKLLNGTDSGNYSFRAFRSCTTAIHNTYMKSGMKPDIISAGGVSA